MENYGEIKMKAEISCDTSILALCRRRCPFVPYRDDDEHVTGDNGMGKKETYVGLAHCEAKKNEQVGIA